MNFLSWVPVPRARPGSPAVSGSRRAPPGLRAGQRGHGGPGPVASVSLRTPTRCWPWPTGGRHADHRRPELPLRSGSSTDWPRLAGPFSGRASGRAHRDQKVWAKHSWPATTCRPLASSSPNGRGRVRGAQQRAPGLAAGDQGRRAAGGKGVVLVNRPGRGDVVIDEMLTGTQLWRGRARIVLEECLVGPEVSFFVLTDGRRAMAIGSAQDRETRARRRRGPNTGGMGALRQAAADARARGAGARGSGASRPGRHARRGPSVSRLSVCGLMLTAQGPKVIEFNARLGTPRPR